MYAVLGENRSDAETIKVLMGRLAPGKTMSITAFGYDGCAELLRKGARQIKVFLALGFTKFVICYDADRDDPEVRRNDVMTRVVVPAGLTKLYCVVVPIQEIEAWILADISAVTKVFPSWIPDRTFPQPENVDDPKELLERLSRQNNKRPIYSHETHNRFVAEQLTLEIVRRKCPSFQPLVDFVFNVE